MRFSNNRSGNGRTRAKLSFDDGFAERPFYSIKAFINEKDKGIDMLKLIKDNFNISSLDEKESFDKKLREMREEIAGDDNLATKKNEPIKWTRDSKGNIISPYSVKNKS